MNTLIIGNGFDLAHKLPTSYSDFLNRISSNHSKFKQFIIDNSNLELYNKVKKSTIFNFMQSQQKNNNWIDFENELKIIVDSFCKLPEQLEETIHRQNNSITSSFTLKVETKYLSPFMYNFLLKYNKNTNSGTRFTSIELSCLKEVLYSQILDFINLFKEYIKWINKIPIINSIDLFFKMDVDYFLSFNYTTTFLKLYNTKDKIPPENICFVHGKIDEKTDNGIVMGIGSDFYDESKHDDFVEFFKFFQRYKYSTDTNYLDWIEDYKISKFKEGSKHTIYIYGHSLDPTDRDILLPFFDLGNINIIIYYLDERSKSNLEKNLLKLLGKKRFQKYLIGNPSKVKFEKVPEK